MNMKLFKHTAVGALMALSVGAASAAGYCSQSAAESAIMVSDITFNTVASNDCYGFGITSGQNEAEIVAFANTTGLWTPSPWAHLVRDVSGGLPGTGSASGYGFTLTAIAGSNGFSSGTYTLAVTGTPIPFQMDFLVAIHAGGGQREAFYFFDNRQINAGNVGTFQIANLNNNNQPRALSNFDILYRDIQEIGGCQTPGGCNPEIPEPASLALVGVALFGLGIARRRRQAAAAV